MKILSLKAEPKGDMCMQGYEAEAEMDDGTYVNVTYADGNFYSVTTYSLIDGADDPETAEFLECYEDLENTGEARYEARKSKYGWVFEFLISMLDILD